MFSSRRRRSVNLHEDLSNRVRYLMDVVINMKVVIDGIDLKSLRKYRASSRVFDLSISSEQCIWSYDQGLLDR